MGNEKASDRLFRTRQPAPPRSGLVQLLSILPALPAVYSGALQSEKPKSAAIFIIKSRFVNLSPRQTPPVGRCIQISARSVARQHLPNLNTKFPKDSFGFFLSAAKFRGHNTYFHEALLVGRHGFLISSPPRSASCRAWCSGCRCGFEWRRSRLPSAIPCIERASSILPRGCGLEYRPKSAAQR